jgi:eukaryotic-like serine/threonine-protein kinase
LRENAGAGEGFEAVSSHCFQTHLNRSDVMSTQAQVEAIFFAALDMKTEAERSLYLDYACGDDAGLRGRVERLLAAHPKAAEFLARPAFERHGVEPAEGTERVAGSKPGTGAGAAPSGNIEPLETLADPRDEEDDDNALAVLEPSKQAGSLGRLGHYEVVEVLGKGSFGTVVKGLDEKLRRFAAIKLMSPLLAATSPARKRFLREARSAAAVRHQSVVAIYAVEDKPIPYLVMEYIAGQTLQQKLDATGPLEVPEVLRLGRQIAEGLAAAHATGLIHRDVKPSNILLEQGVEQVKITDFGLARAADDASISTSGLIAGTPMYMAPEQARAESIDHRADLFSLGSVLYTMSTGRPPFRAANTMAVLKRVTEDTPRPIREIIPEVPEWLCDLIARLHAKDPADRFASAREVADLLAQHTAEPQRPQVVRSTASENTVLLREISEAKPVIRRPRFRKRGWAVAATLFVMILGSLGFTEATGVTDVHGTVVRLFSPEGTLVVEVDDPEVSVKVDGSDVVITGAGAREIRLKPGRYSVEARKNGKLVRQELVNVTRDGRPVVRVTREAPPEPTKAADATANASAWERSVAAMPAIQQVKAVSSRLKELNPDFDGAVVPTIEDGVVTELKLSANQLTDLSPVHALTKLTSLDCSGQFPTIGRLIDLSPLSGLSLTRLECSRTSVYDLSPLKGMPLETLHCGQTKVSDLSPLKGMKLRHLEIQATQVSDLTPLQGMPLTFLDLYRANRVSNLKPLQGMPLEYLNLTDIRMTDLSVLKGMTSLQKLVLTNMPISDLAPLQDLKPKELNIDGTQVSDLALLKTFPLVRLGLDYQPGRQELLRSLKGLKWINNKPAAQFWKEVDEQAKDR